MIPQHIPTQWCDDIAQRVTRKGGMNETKVQLTSDRDDNNTNTGVCVKAGSSKSSIKTRSAKFSTRL